MHNGQKKKGAKELLEGVIAEKSPNLMKSINLYVQEEWASSRINTKRSMPRHNIVTRLKNKVKVLKAVRGKQFITCKESALRATADVSSETVEAKRHI